MKHLIHLTLALGVIVIAPESRALESGAISVHPVLSTSVTSSGQKIVLPRNNAHLSVSTYEIAPGAALPEHKHLFPRWGYVLSGSLHVTNMQTGKVEIFKPGDFIVESIDQWHKGANGGTEPVRLLVIDITPGVRTNTVVKK